MYREKLDAYIDSKKEEMPVSYTHLDVYKRQRKGRAEGRARRGGKSDRYE